MIKEVKDPSEEYRVIRNDRELREKLKMVMEDPDVELDFFKGLNREVPPASMFMKGTPKPLPLRWRVKKRIKTALLITICLAVGFVAGLSYSGDTAASSLEYEELLRIVDSRLPID